MGGRPSTECASHLGEGGGGARVRKLPNLGHAIFCGLGIVFFCSLSNFAEFLNLTTACTLGIFICGEKGGGGGEIFQCSLFTDK